MFVVQSPILVPGGVEQAVRPNAAPDYDSSKLTPLTKEQIRSLLSGVLEEYFRVQQIGLQ